MWTDLYYQTVVIDRLLGYLIKNNFCNDNILNGGLRSEKSQFRTDLTELSGRLFKNANVELNFDCKQIFILILYFVSITLLFSFAGKPQCVFYNDDVNNILA